MDFKCNECGCIHEENVFDVGTCPRCGSKSVEVYSRMCDGIRIVNEQIHKITKEYLDEKSLLSYKEEVERLMLVIKKCRHALAYNVDASEHVDALIDCEKAIFDHDGVAIDAEMRQRMKEW